MNPSGWPINGWPISQPKDKSEHSNIAFTKIKTFEIKIIYKKVNGSVV